MGKPPNPVIDGKKLCPKCNQVKPVEEFSLHHTGKYAGLPFSWCKLCARLATKKWECTNPNHRIEHRRQIGESRPLEEAKDCSTYLGVYVAEKALSRFFDNIIRMPRCNPGYDFLCGRGFKIDVKSACLTLCVRKYPGWYFNVKRNNITDYFLCLAFDDRDSLEPQHVWLIPGEVLNKKDGFWIFDRPKPLSRWSKYERPLDRVQVCCEALRDVSMI